MCAIRKVIVPLCCGIFGTYDWRRYAAFAWGRADGACFRLLKEIFLSGKRQGNRDRDRAQSDKPEKIGDFGAGRRDKGEHGDQSFSDQELSVLGRRHGAKQAREALGLIKTYGFPCVNVDFIYGVPGQTVTSLLASLKEALTFAPDEIFLYPLYVKHGVRMERAGVVPDAEAAYLQYREASGFLRGEGFRQDSMRRFVRRGGKREFSECGMGTSLALGCGGRSYVGKLHFCSPYAITGKECLKRLEEYENTVDFTDVRHGILLSEEEIKRRYLIRHLLIYPGVDIQKYESCFGSGLMEDFPVLQDWMEEGWVRWNDSQEKRCKRKAGESSLL